MRIFGRGRGGRPKPSLRNGPGGLASTFFCGNGTAQSRREQGEHTWRNSQRPIIEFRSFEESFDLLVALLHFACRHRVYVSTISVFTIFIAVGAHMRYGRHVLSRHDRKLEQGFIRTARPREHNRALSAPPRKRVITGGTMLARETPRRR